MAEVYGPNEGPCVYCFDNGYPAGVDDEGGPCEMCDATGVVADDEFEEQS